MAGEILLAALRHVLSTLTALKVNMALMGGIAVAAWNHPRNTRDVDLLVGVKPSEEEELLRRLSEAGIKPVGTHPFVAIGKFRIVQLSYEPPGRFLDIRVDLFIADSEYQLHALSRRLAITLPGVDDPVYLLKCEDLILFKLMAGRLIDWADSAYLLRANRDSLDMGYLTQWATRLFVTDELGEVWREAFGTDAVLPV